MSRPSREAVMEALFNTLVGSLVTNFTADTTAGSRVLLNPSVYLTADGTWTADSSGNAGGLCGIFLGLPVFGPGIRRGAVITDITPSIPPTADGTWTADSDQTTDSLGTAASITISFPATETATGVSMTTGFVTARRRAKFTNDVQQPAIFLRSMSEEIEYQGLMEALTIRAQVLLSTSAGENPDVVPETALNYMLDAIRASLAPDSMTGQFTLGGLVAWCRMIGKIDKDPGDLGPTAIAVADIEIIVP